MKFSNDHGIRQAHDVHTVGLRSGPEGTGVFSYFAAEEAGLSNAPRAKHTSPGTAVFRHRPMSREPLVMF